MNPDALRQLIANCRKKRNRVVGRPPDMPSDWCPHKIQNPEMPAGYPFTDDSAWEFIAAKLEGGHPFDMVFLEKPAGERALVMQISLPDQICPLYVKVQIGRGNFAIGRSFHLSYAQGNTSNGPNLIH